jgi:adenylyltransferase/sulfurtransferase
MDDSELQRYSRHILLPQIDIAGQQKLLASRALVIGLGGLGSPVAMYLAASGVGHLTLVDHDKVELTNLQRQIVHATAHIGVPKTESAARRLEALNPGVQLTLIARKLDGAALEEEARRADVVVDTTDNFASRFEINEACMRAGIPLVSGAVVRFEGQVAVFPPGGPCYRCLYTETGGPDEPCATFGVLAPATGVIGAIQATEAIKVLLGLGQTLAGRLLLFDALRMEWREVKLRKDPECPVCGTVGETSSVKSET